MGEKDNGIFFDMDLLKKIESCQEKNSTALSTRITLNLSREEVDYITWLIRKQLDDQR